MKAMENPQSGIAIVLAIFLAAAAIAAAGRVPQTTQSHDVTAFVWVYATPAPTIAMPTADMTLAVENAALKQRIADLEAERKNSQLQEITIEPQPVYQTFDQDNPDPTPAVPGYTAQTDQGPVFVPDSATPVPATGYDGPFLQPQVTVLPNAVQYCTGFHDWRDYDAAYEASSVCRQP